MRLQFHGKIYETTYSMSQVHEVNCSLLVGSVAFGGAGNVNSTPMDRLQESTKAHLATLARSLLEKQIRMSFSPLLIISRIYFESRQISNLLERSLLGRKVLSRFFIRQVRELTSRVMSSSTILFCLGTRPALLPEEMHRAPVSVIEFPPTVGSGERICSGNIAYSYNSATL